MSPDNKHIVNEQFTDLAWTEMSKLLDKEMPVKKPKKRLFWLWFAGLMLLGFWGLGYYLGQQNNTLSAFPIKEEAITYQSNKTPQKSDNQVIKKENSNLQIKSHQSRHAIVTLSNTLKPSFEKNREEASLEISSPVASPPNHKLSIAKKYVSKVNEDTKASALENPSPSPAEAINTRIAFEKVDELPILGLFPSFEKNIWTIQAQAHTPAKFKWHFGLYGAYIFQQKNAFRAGIGSRFQFHRRWSINLGLGYSNRQLKQALANNQNSDFSTDNAPILPTSGGDPKEEEITSISGPERDSLTAMNLQIAFQRLHYIDLPVSIEYQVRPKLSIEAGGQVSRLLGYHYTQNGDEDYAPANSTTIFSNPQENPFSKWQFSTFGGITYAISSNLQLKAQYHLGLNNYYQNENDSKKWKYATIGLSFWY